MALLELQATHAMFGLPYIIFRPHYVYGELARLTGYGGKCTHGPAKKGEVRTTFLNANRARRELGWNPQVTLSEGLARTVAALRERERA
jgi:nucleoside-diphosphate-sugar epimerase